ncbi:MAG TPA: hypothetical protein DEQ09_08090, partial [Bacteroidales bacterium]|nr:hypothetical protein [Bacteroidales bacterium]
CKSENEINISIRDINGRKILQERFTGSIELNISDISPGIYIIMLGDQCKWICQSKVVISRPAQPVC